MFNIARTCNFFANDLGILVHDGRYVCSQAAQRIVASIRKGRFSVVTVTVKPKPVVIFEDSDTLDADGLQEPLDAAESEA